MCESSDEVCTAYFNHGFSLSMTERQARGASHAGACDEDVASLVALPQIAAQIYVIGPDKIRAELGEYGAWDEDELEDDEANRRRIVWIAAGNIREELNG